MKYKLTMIVETQETKEKMIKEMEDMIVESQMEGNENSDKLISFKVEEVEE